jgi:hypothetical protein
MRTQLHLALAVLLCCGVAQAQTSKPQTSSNSSGTVDKGPLKGFTGRTCEEARANAQRGAGTSSDTIFEEVRTEKSGNGCLVQGYRYSKNPNRSGGASRQ